MFFRRLDDFVEFVLSAKKGLIDLAQESQFAAQVTPKVQAGS
jgi:hypothetical protein